MENNVFDEYILISSGTDYVYQMWSDIDSLKNGYILYSPLKKCNKIVKFFHHIHFSFFLNKKINIPFKNIWDAYYSLNEINFDQNKKYCIIFLDNSISRISIKYLKKMKQKHNLTYILMNLNTIDKKENIIKRYFYIVDLKVTFDYQDSIKYNILFYPNIFSKITCNDITNSDDIYDIIFVGNAKDRLKVIHNIYEVLNKKFNVKFYVNGVKKKDKIYQGIIYNKWLTYKEIYYLTMHSKAILEVVDENQKGYTLRTFESICYNKHLITNNKFIIQSSFYNDQYIHIYQDANDLKGIYNTTINQKVEFNYNNEFSSLHFIEFINYQFVKKGVDI